MITFALNNNHDIYAANGQIALVDGNDEIKQTLDTRLKVFQGEYYLDPLYGLPYWQTIQNETNVNILDINLRTTMLGTSGVNAVAKFESLINTNERLYTVNATVTTNINNTIITLTPIIYNF